ncbi:MAG TPA: DUF2617 family protein [Acidimicrobiia bacterium]|nr:DUF2617 family protein [Acidimicrobiia bacterium]
METRLRVPYRDTTADALVWRLGEPRRPALAALELEVAGGRLELRLLGSSHQVVFTAPNPGGGTAVVSEIVACGSGAPGLPPTAERSVDGWTYEFRATTRCLPADRFGPRIDGLVARLTDLPTAIVGRFPGSPHAVTALLADPRPGGTAIRWRTWHAYPQDQRLVSTATTVRPR